MPTKHWISNRLSSYLYRLIGRLTWLNRFEQWLIATCLSQWASTRFVSN